MSDIVVPNFPKNTSPKTWDKFYRWACDEQEADKFKMKVRNLQVKNQYKGCFEKPIDGIGECYATMDSRTYHRMLQDDPDFWKDPSNHKSFFRDNDRYLNQGHLVK